MRNMIYFRQGKAGIVILYKKQKNRERYVFCGGNFLDFMV